MASNQQMCVSLFLLAVVLTGLLNVVQVCSLFFLSIVTTLVMALFAPFSLVLPLFIFSSQ